MAPIVDRYGHAILTLTERSTNFLLMQRLPLGRKAGPMTKAAIRQLFPYREHVRTITTDNGSEFAAHKGITRVTIKVRQAVTVYFADSYLFMADGDHREREQAHKEIHIPKTELQQGYGRIHHESTEENQCKTHGKIEF